MPIKNRQEKINGIVDVISNPRAIGKINSKWGDGPDLYFYRRVLASRKQYETVDGFLNTADNTALLYATLAIWGMHTRGAKMKNFDAFKQQIAGVSKDVTEFEEHYKREDHPNYEKLLTIYQNLHVMVSKSKLISNAKLLHFLLPEILLPMDGLNTLRYLYGNDEGSQNKYEEVVRFSFDIRSVLLARDIDWEASRDDGWNGNLPKLIDNAIILLSPPPAP